MCFVPQKKGGGLALSINNECSITTFCTIEFCTGTYWQRAGILKHTLFCTALHRKIKHICLKEQYFLMVTEVIKGK